MQINIEVTQQQEVEIPKQEIFRIIKEFIKEEFDLELTDIINKDGEIERLEIMPSPYGRMEDRKIIRNAFAYEEVILQFLQILDAREKGKEEIEIINSGAFDNTWGVTKISKEEIDEAAKTIEKYLDLCEKKTKNLQKELNQIKEELQGKQQMKRF